MCDARVLITAVPVMTCGHLSSRVGHWHDNAPGPSESESFNRDLNRQLEPESPCVSLLYVDDIGSTGSGGTVGIPYHDIPFTLTLTLTMPASYLRV